MCVYQTLEIFNKAGYLQFNNKLVLNDSSTETVNFIEKLKIMNHPRHLFPAV